MSYVTLASPPLNWQDYSTWPGADGNLGGYANSLALYKRGGNNRILLNEAWGWSVYDNSNPMAPRRVSCRMVQAPWRDRTTANDPGYYSVTTGGDGQSATMGFCVSPDGQRLGAYMGASPVEGWMEVVGDPEGEDFRLEKAIELHGAYGQAMQQINGRYIVYAGEPHLSAYDITNLPSSGLVLPYNSEPPEVNTNFPEGEKLFIKGNFLIYAGVLGIVIVNVSNPGPVGSILNNIPSTTITSTVLGLTAGQRIGWYTASVDPTDSSKLWMLIPVTGSSYSVTYFLVSVTSNLTVTVVGTTWTVPNPTVYGQNASIGNALVINNNILYALMWDDRQTPLVNGDSSNNILYSTSVDQWTNINTTSPPSMFAMPANLPNFVVGQSSGCLSVGNNIYMYMACGSSAFVVPLTCVVTGGGGGGGTVVLDAPTGLEVSKINDTTVRLLWTPPV